jgi:hypothetical protein
VANFAHAVEEDSISFDGTYYASHLSDQSMFVRFDEVAVGNYTSENLNPLQMQW